MCSEGLGLSTRDWGLEELGEIMESFMVGVSPS